MSDDIIYFYKLCLERVTHRLALSLYSESFHFSNISYLGGEKSILPRWTYTGSLDHHIRATDEISWLTSVLSSLLTLPISSPLTFPVKHLKTLIEKVTDFSSALEIPIIKYIKPASIGVLLLTNFLFRLSQERHLQFTYQLSGFNKPLY